MVRGSGQETMTDPWWALLPALTGVCLFTGSLVLLTNDSDYLVILLNLQHTAIQVLWWYERQVNSGLLTGRTDTGDGLSTVKGHSVATEFTNQFVNSPISVTILLKTKRQGFEGFQGWSGKRYVTKWWLSNFSILPHLPVNFIWAKLKGLYTRKSPSPIESSVGFSLGTARQKGEWGAKETWAEGDRKGGYVSRWHRSTGWGSLSQRAVRGSFGWGLCSPGVFLNVA